LTVEKPDVSASPTPARSPGLSGSSGPSAPPPVLGDFELRREIGRGGMGTVYEAWQRSLQRVVALKVLSAQVSASRSAVLRFQREAQAAAQLHHSHIIPIYAQGEQDGFYFYAMELVDGRGLNTIIAEARDQAGRTTALSDPDETVALPRTEAGAGSDADTVRLERQKHDQRVHADSRHASGASGDRDMSSGDSAITLNAVGEVDSSEERFGYIARHVAAVADALEYAHRQGVIHRDIKPHNLMMGEDGRLRIADFGLARIKEEPGVTVTGEFIGSPLYMSREQLTHDSSAVDHRTDVYSLGATMYEWLTFQPPFPGDTRERVISKILHAEPIPPTRHNPSIPVDLETICLKAIEKDPNQRYQTAGEMRDDLKRFVESHPIKARRIGLATRVGRFFTRRPADTLAIAAIAICAFLLAASGFLLKALVSSKKEVATQIEAVRVERAEKQQILDMLRRVTPVEAEVAARTAEELAPVLDGLVEAGQQVATAVQQAEGPDPRALGSVTGLAERVAIDLYRTRMAERQDESEEHAVPEEAADSEEARHRRTEAALLRQAEQSEDPVTQLDLASHVVEINPKNDQARELLMALMCREGRFSDMLDHANVLLARHSDAVEPYVWRGLAYLMSGAADRALEDCVQALQIDGLSPWARTLRGLAFLQMSRTETAMLDLTTALGVQPDLVAARLGRAVAKASLQEYDDAVADISQVLELEPENADVLALRGTYYVAMGRYEEAADDYNSAMSLGGYSTEMIMSYLAARSRIRRDLPEGEAPGDSTSVPTEAGHGGEGSSGGWSWNLIDRLFGGRTKTAEGQGDTGQHYRMRAL
jgi:serine/threonine protein kinase/tetratricopeptide (TPR) repeat protein